MIIVSKYFLLFIIYSFFGWLMEMVVCSTADKRIVNRGFLIGPYCPIYGCGCLLILSLLRRYENDPFTLFVMAVLVCSLLEYLTSYIMEKLFKARWWDYSNRRFNINGRICLDNLLVFGILGLFIYYLVNPFLVKLISFVPDVLIIVIAFILFVVYLVDTIISFKIISGFKNVAKSIRKDSTEEITRRVKELLLEKGWLYKRLVSAFNFEASERLLRAAKETVEKGAREAKKHIDNGKKIAEDIIKAGVETAKKTIEDSKKKQKKRKR